MLKVHRNPDPILHPFEQGREYTRALNAAKLDKMFAKPFVGALEGHMDGVFSMTTNRKSLVSFVSGACDGEIKVWDLASKRNLWSTIGHTGFVRGLSSNLVGDKFLSCGDDKTVKLWNFVPSQEDLHAPDEQVGRSRVGRRRGRGGAGGLADTPSEKIVEPLKVFATNSPVLSVDHYWADEAGEREKFATTGETLDFWDITRNQPLHSFSWSTSDVDTISDCKFNPAEKDLIATVANDRSISLFDVRQKLPLRKVVMSMNSNCISWNPMEPFRFVVGNEDHNCYTFDVRNFKRPVILHRSHVGAVLSVSFSPTGKEFVSGSYDKTLRIYNSESWTSREVYHTKRMQRLFSVAYSADSRFVLSGSDDTNIRIWKARANDRLGKLAPREEQSANYSQRLVQRYKHAKQIRRLVKHKHLPKNVYKQVKRKRVMTGADMRREQNRIRHSKGTLEKEPEKDKPVVKEIE